MTSPASPSPSPPCRAAAALGCLAIASLLSASSVASAGDLTGGRVVMGTVLSITVANADPVRLDETISRAYERAEHWDDVLTTWREDGELARLNSEAGGGRQEISADLSHALRRMLELSRETGGAFDPAVAPLVEALRTQTTAPPRPADRGIAHVLSVGDEHAALAAGAALDAGGIGKGIAVDAALELLRLSGISSAYIDFGGSSIAAIGERAPGVPWSVALVGNRAGQVLGRVDLRDAALSTSRSSPPNDPAGAIVDPKSWAPVVPGRLATAIANDAASAEAWSTALVVLGRSGLAAAARHGLRALVVDTDGLAHTPDFGWTPFDQPPQPSAEPETPLAGANR